MSSDSNPYRAHLDNPMEDNGNCPNHGPAPSGGTNLFIVLSLFCFIVQLPLQVVTAVGLSSHLGIGVPGFGGISNKEVLVGASCVLVSLTSSFVVGMLCGIVCGGRR